MSDGDRRRFESSATSISWIPREAIEGLAKLPFSMGVGSYDLPPPDVLDDVEALLAKGAFRFANELRGWIAVEDGRITGYGQEGHGYINVTRLKLGGRTMTFPPIPLDDLRPEPQVTGTSVRFVQSSGGRTGVPAPRRVERPPYVRWGAPLAWTTLALTINADGSSEFELVGASPFPRHWVYDSEGRLATKSGVIDFDRWYRTSLPETSPWGDQDSPVLNLKVESELERTLSRLIVDAQPKFRTLRAGETLVRQGDLGKELFLLFDGVLEIEEDGKRVAEVGPGAIIGEMALLEGGRRTATARALTACRVVIAPLDAVDRSALARIAAGRRGDKEAAQTESEVLRRIPFFQDLTDQDLRQIGALGERRTFAEGEAIVEKGTHGMAMFVILSGTASVETGGRVHQLEPGDFVGEMSMLAGKPRSATVTALEPVEALAIETIAFKPFLMKNPSVAVALLERVASRLREVQDRVERGSS
jgi:CRP-like cAMP-binding protein